MQCNIINDNNNSITNNDINNNDNNKTYNNSNNSKFDLLVFQKKRKYRHIFKPQ